MAIQEISAAVTARQVAELYGLKFDRRGQNAMCPWHNDHSPSLSFKGRKCRCFACNNGGDAVDLTAQIFGESVLYAAMRLQHDFGIVVSGKKVDLPKLRAKQREKERTKEVERRRYIKLCNIERNNREALKTFDPDTAWDDKRFIALLRAFAQAQDELNGWNA